MTLKIFSRSSDLKSENGCGLAGYEFLSVPHTNYVSISHRLVTVHKRDTRRWTMVDDDDSRRTDTFPMAKGELHFIRSPKKLSIIFTVSLVIIAVTLLASGYYKAVQRQF